MLFSSGENGERERLYNICKLAKFLSSEPEKYLGRFLSLFLYSYFFN